MAHQAGQGPLGAGRLQRLLAKPLWPDALSRRVAQPRRLGAYPTRLIDPALLADVGDATDA
jgi:hypothetical protein